MKKILAIALLFSAIAATAQPYIGADGTRYAERPAVIGWTAAPSDEDLAAAGIVPATPEQVAAWEAADALAQADAA